ncbi:MFS transporter [Streptomyces sp. SD11]|uniref:MFS transporter n=1 Tax=Streptomyces sp. SD11 TaxID=3452209 RepID=UPI003F891F70
MSTSEITAPPRRNATVHQRSGSSGRGRGRNHSARPFGGAAPAKAGTSTTVSWTAWMRPAAAVFTVGWGANMFASVLQVYRGNLNGFQVNALFGAYALGLIPSLLIMARVSERLGRRRVLLSALLLSALGSAVILFPAGRSGRFWPGESWSESAPVRRSGRERHG